MRYAIEAKIAFDPVGGVIGEPRRDSSVFLSTARTGADPYFSVRACSSTHLVSYQETLEGGDSVCQKKP